MRFALGLVAMSVLASMGCRAGVISAAASAYSGAMFGCTMPRKTEPGLWMLAVRVAVETADFSLFGLAMEIRAWMRGKTR